MLLDDLAIEAMLNVSDAMRGVVYGDFGWAWFALGSMIVIISLGWCRSRQKCMMVEYGTRYVTRRECGYM